MLIAYRWVFGSWGHGAEGGAATGWGCRDGYPASCRDTVSYGMAGLEPSGRVFAGTTRTKGDGRKDAMTTFWGFPGN